LSCSMREARITTLLVIEYCCRACESMFPAAIGWRLRGH
jgi:hypothetical protein